MPSTPSPLTLAFGPSGTVALETFGNFAQEACGAWACGLETWTAYMQRLSAADSPAAVYAAGAQFMTDNLEIFSRAAGARLLIGGLPAPLLNDA
jgi:hypothetical protein